MRDYCKVLLLLGAALGLMATALPGYAQVSAAEDRASVFVAGAAAASESFGQGEGIALLSIGAALILAAAISLVMANRRAEKTEATLERLESRLVSEDKAHG